MNQPWRHSDLSALFGGTCPSLESLRRLVQKLVVHPEHDDDGTVVAVRANGSAAKPRHVTIAKWVAIELLRLAPKGYKTPFMTVTNVLGQAPGSSGWVALNFSGQGLVPIDPMSAATTA